LPATLPADPAAARPAAAAGGLPRLGGADRCRLLGGIATLRRPRPADARPARGTVPRRGAEPAARPERLPDDGAACRRRAVDGPARGPGGAGARLARLQAAAWAAGGAGAAGDAALGGSRLGGGLGRRLGRRDAARLRPGGLARLPRPA